MNKHIMSYRTCLLFSLLLTLSACALSPQKVTIAPAIAVDKSLAVSGNVPLSLEVTDTRGDMLVGKRGGVYSTADITTGTDVAVALHQSVAKALRELGYQVGTNTSLSPLKIELTKLTYTPSGENVVRAIEVTTEIRATYQNAKKTFTNEYIVKRKKEIVKAPNEVQNNELINDALASVLEQLLADKQLFSLIQQGK